MIPIIVINLIIGLIVPVIDSSAHLGGLIAGGVLAMVIPYYKVGTRDLAIVWRVLQILLLALIPLCFYKVKSNYDGPPLSIKNFDPGLQPGQRTAVTVLALDESSKAFSRAFNQRDPQLTVSGLNELDKAANAAPELDLLRDQMKSILSRLQATLKEAKDKNESPDENILAGLHCERDRWIEACKTAYIRLGPGWAEDPEEVISSGPGCNQ